MFCYLQHYDKNLHVFSIELKTNASVGQGEMYSTEEKLKYRIVLSILTFTMCLIHLIGDDLERHKPLRQDKKGLN